MKTIQLTNGFEAFVDDEDFDLVSQYRWFGDVRPHTVYAKAHVYKDGKRTTIPMHGLICSSENEVDHIDWNGLNNCKSNLRPATRKENASHRKARHLGVHWYSQRSSWRATPYLNGKQIYLGLFSTKEEAVAKASEFLQQAA